MPAVASIALETGCSPPALWAAIARATQAWLHTQACLAADAIVVVPFAQLLPIARRAFAEYGQWMPRIHTTRTLLRSLGPGVSPDVGALSGEWGVDLLLGSQMLRRQAWADAWARRDRRAFDAAVQTLVRTAHMLADGAAELHPTQRDPWWANARGLAGSVGGPAAMDAALLRIAIEWAATGSDADTDGLFSLRPSAWIALNLGGEDRFVAQLLASAGEVGIPGLQLQADAGSDDPISELGAHASIEIVSAADAEEEAWAAALEVGEAIRCGAAPVALIAEDRALVRRVRALLERSGTVIDDETGWSIATTRAGAHADSALRAAQPSASPDELLDWLKSDLGDEDGDALACLESMWRGYGKVDAGQGEVAERLWARERERLGAFASPRRRPLAAWLGAFDALLFAARTRPAWHQDPAALQLRAALRMERGGSESDASWQGALGIAMDLDEFSAWVDAVLESSRFVPPLRAHAAQVVLTPLSQVIGRTFGAVILPGADERRLGAVMPDAAILSQAALRALELPDRAARRRRLAQAFVQLFRVPRVVFLRRRADGDELLAPSVLLDRLVLQCDQRGLPAPLQREAHLPLRELGPAPVRRPVPQAIGRLPESLSASAVEALRQCPYRFFARVVLRLGEQEELDDELDKRDYGRWLHNSLERFHAERKSPEPEMAEVQRLLAAAQAAKLSLFGQAHDSDAALLPYSAGFAAFARRYVRWLRAQEAQGWRFSEAEIEMDTRSGSEPIARLHGRIDRIDVHTQRDAIRLIDYKASARASVRSKVAQPLEDTQLAVYGALQMARIGPATELSACYVALDESDKIVEIEHPGLAHSALCLVQGIAQERLRIEAGAPLLALGEGVVCESCEARGLCRRDHWSNGQPAQP